MAREQYVKADDILDGLRALAADHFRSDPSYQTYLDALEDVEQVMERVRKYPERAVRTGQWLRERPGSYRFHCSRCNYPVFYPRHDEPCIYPYCPACRTQMEVDQ